MVFFIGFSASGLESPQVLESSRFKFIHHMRNTYYYTSPRCKDMSDKYGGLYVKIRNREMEICKRLMEDIYTELFDIHHATSHCAQIDCLMAMASFAQKHKLVPPTFVTDRKILDIKVRDFLIIFIIFFLDLFEPFVLNPLTFSTGWSKCFG